MEEWRPEDGGGDETMRRNEGDVISTATISSKRAGSIGKQIHNSQIRGLGLLVLTLLFLNIYCLLLFHGQLSRQIDAELNFDSNRIDPSLALWKGDSSNNTVVEYFKEAGVKIHDSDLRSLPTWSQIESLIGKNPVTLGLDQCQIYRDKVPPLRRMLGVAGMFNSGTNLATRLLKENCVIPERYVHYGPKASKENYGIRWQVPWGKHTPAMFISNYSAPLAVNLSKADVLPIVTVRNPYDWMISMCEHPYTARWSRSETISGIMQQICPHLVNTDNMQPVGVDVKLADQHLHITSLAHLWNEWYAQYENADIPFLMVRFEDLVFRQYTTTLTICSCAGGQTARKEAFKYIVNSAKQGPGHGAKDQKTDMKNAWIKYGKPKKVKSGYSDEDWDASLQFLSTDLMKKLGYQYPPSE